MLGTAEDLALYAIDLQSFLQGMSKSKDKGEKLVICQLVQMSGISHVVNKELPCLNRNSINIFFGTNEFLTDRYRRL